MAKKKKKTDPTDELSCCMAKEGYIIKVVSGEKTPEQIAQEKQTAERDYYLRWLAKKTKNCSGPQIILQKRTLNTAGVIRIALRDIPFNKLSATLYFFCRDMEYTCLLYRQRQGDEMRANMCSYLQLGIPDDFDDPPDFTQKNYEFIAYGIGGKLRDVYHPDKDGEHRPTGPRAGNEAYEAKPTSIQGFIRRVADGRKPSQEAIDRAAQLGFDLGPDETYVQPFIRNSWKKKQATEEEKPKSSKKKRK